MGLFDFLRRKPPPASASFDRGKNRWNELRAVPLHGTSRSSFMIPRWTTPPSRNTAEWIKAFSETPRLAVVERIASDLSFAAGKLFAVDNNGNEKELSRHPFLTFWNNPNPLHEMSNAALWRLFEIYLKLKGEGYFIIERNELGQPAEMWAVPVHWVQMTPYLDHPYYTVRLTNGILMEVSVDDMFVMRDLNPLDPYRRGLGQTEALADEIEIDEYAAKFQKKFFYNDASPDLVVSLPAGTSKEQQERFRSEWLERFQGANKSHKLAVTAGDVIVNKIGDNMKDLDMVNGRDFVKRAVLEHFGVPREIMGITESSNRATSEAAQYIYAQNVLMPNLKRREEAINKQLLPYFGDNLIWRYDDIIPRNQEFDQKKAIDGWSAGLLTKNEARDLLDMPPIEHGDIYKLQFTDMYMGEADDPVQITTAAANLQYSAEAPLIDSEDDGSTVEITGLKSSSAIHQHKIINGQQRSLDLLSLEQSKKFETVMYKYLTDQVDSVINALQGTQKAAGSIWDIYYRGMSLKTKQTRKRGLI